MLYIRLLTIPTLFVSFIVFSCTHTKPVPLHEPDATFLLHKQIESLLRDPNLASAQIGIYIENLHNGRIIFQHNPFKRFIPASNMKLYTTATALNRLGAEFRYKTGFYINGSIQDSELDGDLIIRGSGDPSISGRFKEDDIFALFRDWADSLKKHGIARIQGNLIGDESYFSGSKLGFGWQWDDEPYWYSAQTNALSFNDNCVDLTIIPGDSAGVPARVETNPSSDFVRIENTAVTVHPDSLSRINISRCRAVNTIEVSGGIPVDRKPIKESITIENPGSYFLKHLRSILDSSGVSVQGECRIINSPPEYDSMNRIFVHRSPQFGELIRVVNKGSHNFYADQLFKTLGSEIKRNGDWRTASEVVKEWLRGIGVAIDQISIYDGSGLSRVNLITPTSTAALLRHMYYHPEFELFYDSLPIAGVDGTLKRRMKGTAAEGNVRAKTGYVMHARALSGYVHDQDETPYLFVIMANHYSVPTPYINLFQDRICILMSNFSRN
jgi:D-alanyl-D-alanine carboxypeptidase/D-alanyl-D-alanine-endopeptidase (penicillin-binding protein 4)